MSCEKAESLLHGYLDGELDAARAVEFERHAQDCPVRTRELDAQQALRARLRDAHLYAPAPPSLRRRIRDRLKLPTGEGAASAPRAGRWRWLAAAAVVALLATAPWLVLRETRRGTADGTLAAAALDAHLRSLQYCIVSDVAPAELEHSPACCGADGAIALSVLGADFEEAASNHTDDPVRV